MMRRASASLDERAFPFHPIHPNSWEIVVAVVFCAALTNEMICRLGGVVSALAHVHLATSGLRHHHGHLDDLRCAHRCIDFPARQDVHLACVDACGMHADLDEARLLWLHRRRANANNVAPWRHRVRDAHRVLAEHAREGLQNHAGLRRKLGEIRLKPGHVTGVEVHRALRVSFIIEAKLGHRPA